jgi:hypothetical protein
MKIIVAAFALALGLTACGSSHLPTLTPAASPGSFIPDLNMVDPTILDTIPANQANALGTGTCEDFVDGDTDSQVLRDGLNANAAVHLDLSAYQIGEIVGVAVRTMCPQYSPQI